MSDKNPLRKPWIVVHNTRYGGPRILDCNGKPVCSFGNQRTSHEGGDVWAWMVARAIVQLVNSFHAEVERE